MKKKKIKKKSKTTLEIGEQLTDKQQMACFFYVNDKDCFGIFWKAYKKAFGCSTTAAQSAGPRLFRNVHIQKYKNSLLDEILNDKELDRELAYVAKQNKDPRAKVSAITELNKVKNRITEKVDVTSKGHAIVGINYVKPDGNNTDTND